MTNMNGFIYGGDYNPEQWLDRPDILEEDIRLMKIAKINVVALGIFSWAVEEPQEGVFNFDWLEDIVNNLYENGISTILATPSGARPRWMANKYEEVLRVDANGQRAYFGQRHNHCFTSPVYREKVRIINTKLAERFKDNPAIIMWHISNEYSGECHCELCKQAFREWLEKKYKDIEVLNKQWWTYFWSHKYSSFDEVEPPSPRGDSNVHGLNIDWHRFTSDSTIDFAKAEIKALRDAGAKQPSTVNMMYNFWDVNYGDFAKEIDVVSWDSYPLWHKGDNTEVAFDNGFQHDFMRALKHKPFMLMESCPTSTNWQSVSKLKKPGTLLNASLQAIAHGSDSVQYFQIRQSLGSSEKFHGAVINHYGSEDTRVFKEVAQVGEALESIKKIASTNVSAPAAVIYDVENRWALEGSEGPRNKDMHHYESAYKSYRALKKYGMNVDVINEDQDLSSYKLVVAPMLYMFRNGMEDKLKKYVADGGTLVMSYWSGIVNENDLCYMGAVPHSLSGVFGLCSQEIDGLYDDEANIAVPVENNALNLLKRYEIKNLCDLVKVSDAKVLMTYGNDWYEGMPAFTVNTYGKGKAYYVCGDMSGEFYVDAYEAIARSVGIEPIISDIADGLEVCSRFDGEHEYVFVSNYKDEPVRVNIPVDAKMLYGEADSEIASRTTIVFEKLDVIVRALFHEDMKECPFVLYTIG